jgi:hypothetical protein
VPFGGRVLQGAGPGSAQGLAGGFLQRLDGEEARVGQAAGEEMMLGSWVTFRISRMKDLGVFWMRLVKRKFMGAP